MTDQEMAKQMAEEFQRLRNWTDAIAVLMSKYRTFDAQGNPLPWRQDVEDVQKLPEFLDLIESREAELASLTSGAEFESSPFRVVWEKYCRSRQERD